MVVTNGNADYADAHARLLREIADETRETAYRTGRSQLSGAVAAAMAAVPRHAFVRAGDRDSAYANRPLPIGHGQTISQPYIVAIMTDLVDAGRGDRVLEIGTGCGYQTAVLAEVAGEVFSIEVIPDLAEAARERLAGLGYANVHVRCGDGRRGWPEEAPFDGIIVTAAPLTIPSALVEQLAVGGRLVVPVGTSGGTQTLLRCVRREDGTLAQQDVLPVSFVPLVDR